MNMEMIKQLRIITGAGLMECKKALTSFNGDMDKSIQFLRNKGVFDASKKAARKTAEGLVQGYVNEDKKVGALVEVNCETDFVAKNDRFKQFVQSILNVIVERDPESLEKLLTLSLEDGKTVNDCLHNLITIFGENIKISRFNCFKTNGNNVVNYYIHQDYLTEGKLGVLLELSIIHAETLFNKKFDELMNSLLIHIAASKPKYLTREQIPKEVLKSQTAIYRTIAESEGKSAEITEKIIQKRLEKFFKMNCLLEQCYVKESELTIKGLLEEANAELENEKINIERFACFTKGGDLDLV